MVGIRYHNIRIPTNANGFVLKILELVFVFFGNRKTYHLPKPDTLLISPATPAAASVWPMLDLTDPIRRLERDEPP